MPVAMVTGGSRGIGRGITERLLRHDHQRLEHLRDGRLDEPRRVLRLQGRRRHGHPGLGGEARAGGDRRVRGEAGRDRDRHDLWREGQVRRAVRGRTSADAAMGHAGRRGRCRRRTRIRPDALLHRRRHHGRRRHADPEAVSTVLAMDTLVINGYEVPVMTANTVVVGTGSAGYCAADRLAMFGQTDVIVVSDKIRAGASRNAGSDKQTYYKLTLSGAEPDSVRSMAETLFSGGAMDGDIALAEAAWSPRAFFHLVESGVPFPHARSGEFIGYKTDHDLRQRATSVGPFTSKSITGSLC